MSRIDRFLTSEYWLQIWSDCSYLCLDRILSDNSPIFLLSNKISNEGSKPFRMLECWKDVKGYHQFVRKKLKNTSFEGWDGYVLKEKLRRQEYLNGSERMVQDPS